MFGSLLHTSALSLSLYEGHALIKSGLKPPSCKPKAGGPWHSQPMRIQVLNSHGLIGFHVNMPLAHGNLFMPVFAEMLSILHNLKTNDCNNVTTSGNNKTLLTFFAAYSGAFWLRFINSSCTGFTSFIDIHLQIDQGIKHIRTTPL